MLSLLVGLLSFVVVLVAGLYLTRHRPAGGGLKSGLERLNALRWRDYERVVVTALQAQGYWQAPDRDSGPDRDSVLLERKGERHLLMCKQGTGSIGPNLLHAMAREMQLQGARRGLLANTGTFEEAAQTVARAQRIELIDGAALWPLVEPTMRHDPVAAAAAPDRKPVIVAWLGALAVGVIAWMVAQGLMPQPVRAPAASATAAASAAAADPVGLPAGAEPGVPAQPDHEPVPTDPAVLERRREDVAQAVATLPGVARAGWSTQSTLLVHLSREDADPVAQLCPLMLRYPELAASRVQLQPPQGSSAAVRFRQCRSY